MKATSLSFLLIFLSFIGKSQGHLEGTKRISTFEDAEVYAESYPEVFLAFMFEDLGSEEYNEGKNSWQYGDLYDVDFYTARIVTSAQKKVYRFNFLAFTDEANGESYSLSEKALTELKSGSSFEDIGKNYSQADSQLSPDVGWTQIDYFIEDFKKSIENAQLGDQFVWHDTVLGRHNLVEITHESKEVDGHYVLFFPRETSSVEKSKVNHHKNIRKLKTQDEIGWYVAQHSDEVGINLVDEGLNLELFNLAKEAQHAAKNNKPILFEGRYSNHRLLSDTSVVLYSLQYIFINGEVISEEDCNSRILEIKEKYSNGVSFDDLVEEYWPDNNGFGKMIDVDGALLVEDLVAKMEGGNVGDLFVAQEGKSYFVGLKLKDSKKVRAFLVLTYPRK